MLSHYPSCSGMKLVCTLNRTIEILREHGSRESVRGIVYLLDRLRHSRVSTLQNFHVKKVDAYPPQSQT
jgi:hypothetical protein